MVFVCVWSSCVCVVFVCVCDLHVCVVFVCVRGLRVCGLRVNSVGSSAWLWGPMHKTFAILHIFLCTAGQWDDALENIVSKNHVSSVHPGYYTAYILHLCVSVCTCACLGVRVTLSLGSLILYNNPRFVPCQGPNWSPFKFNWKSPKYIMPEHIRKCFGGKRVNVLIISRRY